MTTCLDLERSFALYKNWIEKYRYHLKIIKKDQELIVKKGFKIFYAVDFYEIHEFCFPYSDIIHKISDYKDEKKRRRLMELQFARSYFFYGAKEKSKVLLPPYAEEITDFFRSNYATLQKYRNDDLKRDTLRILFQDEKIQEIFRELKTKNGSPEEEAKLLTKIARSSSDIIFLLSSGFLEGMHVLSNLYKERVDIDTSEFYRIVDPEPSQIKCYNYDILKKIGCMDNSKLEKLFDRPGKYLQNKRDAKALQYIAELNKHMGKHKQAIFLVSDADYMRKRLKGAITIDIEGEEYDSIRDSETFYVYLVEIRNFGVPEKRNDQIRILEKIKDSLKQFESVSKLSQNISELVDKCEYWKKENKSCMLCESNSKDKCPFFEEINDIDERLRKIEELRNEIENINLMKHIKVVLSPLFSDDKRTFLELESSSYEERLKSVFGSIGELVENKDEFVKILEDRENQLEDQRLRELYNISFDSISVQEPFMNIHDVLFLTSIPFRLLISERELNERFRDIRKKAATCRDEYLETGKISKENKGELNATLRELAQFSRRIEDDRKYIIWQTIFLCNRRFDLIRIWNEHYRSQIESEVMKRECDYLFCLACYFDMPIHRNLFKDLESVCELHIHQGDSDLRFHHMMTLSLLRLFENSPKKEIFGYAREDIVNIFKDKLLNRIETIDEEFQRAIKNNYCYAVAILIDYQDDRTRYKDDIAEIKGIMEDMKANTDEEEWLYSMEDTLGYIYFLISKYSEMKEKMKYARKAKECFENAEELYPPHERSFRIKDLEECGRMLDSLM